MSIPKELLHNLPSIERAIGYSFQNPSLLATAFIHRSYANEHPDRQEYNERLEFLGDAVLGFLVAAYLYERYPDAPEGELSSMRSRLVDANACIQYMQRLDLSSYLLLGKGEQRNVGRGRESILSDFFEALIGALYLDGGLSVVKTFLYDHFSDCMENLLLHAPRNWKAELQDWSQRNAQITPTYRVIEESGPDHKKHFRIAVYQKDTWLGEGEGNAKKTAQQAAAADAILRLHKEGTWEK